MITGSADRDLKTTDRQTIVNYRFLFFFFFLNKDPSCTPKFLFLWLVSRTLEDRAMCESRAPFFSPVFPWSPVSSFSLSFSSVPSKSPRHRTEQKWTTRAPPVHGTLNTLAAAPPPPPPPPPQHATATTAVRRAAPYLKLAPRRARRLARERSRCVPAGYIRASSLLLSRHPVSQSLFLFFLPPLSLSSHRCKRFSPSFSVPPDFCFRFSHLVRLLLSPPCD